MPHHVVVDGSNLATEGRSQPSLRQLNEAVMAYIADNPDALITVVVDATFGHRIDPKEMAEFDEAVNNNELVAPPAGAIGRGDAFVLSIANKVSATILTNDSYQEFHGQYDWLFDEGRLVGGKPVPHIGWVFVPRLPVRGPLSRKVTAEAKRKGRKSDGGSAKATEQGTVRVGSADANQPMPVPKAPPPGALVPAKRGAKAKLAAAKEPEAKHTTKHETTKQDTTRHEPTKQEATAEGQAPVRHAGVNDLLSFLTFVERHPVGTSVNAMVDHYSSHGAYVKVGDVMGYVPLRLMADPAPRSAREFMKVGEALTLVVEKFVPEKRSIDLSIPGVGVAQLPEPKPTKAAKPTKATKAAAKAVTEPKQPKATKKADKPLAAPIVEAPPEKAKRASKKAAAPVAPVEVPTVAPAKKSPAKKVPVKNAAPAPKKAAPAPKKAVAKKAAAKKSSTAVAAPVEVAPASTRRGRTTA